jgi:hypothetical protein
MKNFENRYLGDGVYASCNGYHIILDLRAQDLSCIALEPEVFQALIQYEKDARTYYRGVGDEGG